jgi:hypothetical protein
MMYETAAVARSTSLMSQKLTRGRCECHRFAHAEGIADVASVVGDMDATDVVDSREDHAAKGAALKTALEGSCY